MTGRPHSLWHGAQWLFALFIVVALPVACAMHQNAEITRRVRAACVGDLAADKARASACTLALTRDAPK